MRAVECYNNLWRINNGVCRYKWQKVKVIINKLNNAMEDENKVEETPTPEKTEDKEIKTEEEEKEEEDKEWPEKEEFTEE